MEKLTLGSLTIKNIFHWIVHFFEVLIDVPILAIVACVLAAFACYFAILFLALLGTFCPWGKLSIKDLIRTRWNRIRRELNTAYIPKYRKYLPIVWIVINTIVSFAGIVVWHTLRFLLFIATMVGVIYLINYLSEKVFSINIFETVSSFIFKVLVY